MPVCAVRLVCGPQQAVRGARPPVHSARRVRKGLYTEQGTSDPPALAESLAGGPVSVPNWTMCCVFRQKRRRIPTIFLKKNISFFVSYVNQQFLYPDTSQFPCGCPSRKSLADCLPVGISCMTKPAKGISVRIHVCRNCEHL